MSRHRCGTLSDLPANRMFCSLTITDMEKLESLSADAVGPDEISNSPSDEVSSPFMTRFPAKCPAVIHTFIQGDVSSCWSTSCLRAYAHVLRHARVTLRLFFFFSTASRKQIRHCVWIESGLESESLERKSSGLAMRTMNKELSWSMTFHLFLLLL